MKKQKPVSRIARLLIPACALTLAATSGLHAQDAAKPAAGGGATGDGVEASGDAQKAWQDLAAQNARPVIPPTWSKQSPPKDDEMAAWRTTESARLMKVAAAAGDFVTKFPKSDKADQARRKQGQALEAASRMGNEEATTKLAAIEDERLKSGGIGEEERVQLRMRQIQRTANGAKDRDGAMAAYAVGARELIKEFPKRPEPYGMLVQIAENMPAEKAKEALKEVTSGDAPAEAKAEAQKILDRMDAVGKPVDVKFAAIDGREVDLSAMKGKVVLIDFWATWCGPCVAEIPNVKAAYEKLHPKGFEIVGLSFDQEKPALEKFVKEKEMTWPQYFDGKGWKNQFGEKFGIRSIPTMWLVDKQGNLRDMNGREGLVEKVEKMLAE